MEIFRRVLKELPTVQNIDKSVRQKDSPICVTGLSGIHKAQLVYALTENERISLIVSDSEATARKICDDINMMADEQIAFFYPSKEFVFTTMEGVSREYEHIRLETLSNVVKGKCKIISASIEAVMQMTIPKKILEENILEISTEKDFDIQEISRKLVSMGYVKSEKTEGVSQFSVRGSIFDIFPVGSQQPVRIELWGDEIDSINYFDSETQRRTENIEKFFVAPALETIFDRNVLAGKIDELKNSLSKSKHNDKVGGKLQYDIELLKNDVLISNADKYMPLIYDGFDTTIFSYVNTVWLSEYSALSERAKNILSQHTQDLSLLLDEGELCRKLEGYLLSFSKVKFYAENYPCIWLNTFMQGSEHVEYKKLFHIEASQNSAWGGEMRQLTDDLNSYCKNGYRVILMAGSEKTLPIIKDDLNNSGIPCDIIGKDEYMLKGRVLLMCGSLSAGFEYPENKIAVVTQAKAMQAKRRKLKKHNRGEEIRNLSDISVGDLVVHALHGIGRFAGIKKLELEGITKDYITIQYAGTDTLYVPVTQLDMVSRYISGGRNDSVKLNKLSSTEWQRTRNNVKKAVKDMAGELIALYAKRQQSKGFAFSEDDSMQRDFEERFPYTETDDQLQSIEEIKADMMKQQPMDRLLCGDVGFGKTEVALRASFKCVLDGKQCAILVPTTVLALQHYQTALKRFEHFPVKVELLSRFRTPKQQAEILKDLKLGKIDIIIGTHRLVQKDVVFKDLGLAIIDEEQRFGVAHKEKFKKSFVGIDVLTLSATPIPRTLNMAMSGIRDMSVIEEPPQDRHPVQTYVLEHNIGVLVQAISKELKRGGQVYYIHNRIDTITACTARLQQLLPEARIAYAHGQMTEEKMSEIWRQLVEHEIDVLVCTTIIETGVDVPNVNTLIIEDADYLGLSQLYQLRGRVGRSNRRAYAYFTFRKEKVLTEVAQKRLNAIKEFTQFGSGFRIALRDLEIRGAGGILSGKQHGHMEAVGYDMYLKLLSEAIAEEKGEAPPENTIECTVDVQIDAHIPETYIESLNQRLDIYKKIATVKTEDDKSDIIDELIDRYGEPPKSVTGLLKVAMLRNSAIELGITEITQRNGYLLFYTVLVTPQQLLALSDAFKGRVSFTEVKKPHISVRLEKNENPIKLMESVLAVMLETKHKETLQLPLKK